MSDESPLIAGARKVYDTLVKYGATKDTKPAKDTTDYKWHEDMVKKANESHTKNEKTPAKKPLRKKGYRK